LFDQIPGRSFFCVIEVIDVNTLQCIYEQGAGTRGISLSIQSGSIYLRAWNDSTNDGPGDDWGDGSSRPDAVVSQPISPGIYFVGGRFTQETQDDLYDGELALFISETSNSPGPLTKLTLNANIGKLYSHSGDVAWFTNGSGKIGTNPSGSAGNTFIGRRQLIGYSSIGLTDLDFEDFFNSISTTSGIYGTVQSRVGTTEGYIVVDQRTGEELVNGSNLFVNGEFLGIADFSIKNLFFSISINGNGYDLETVYDWLAAAYVTEPITPQIELALLWSKGEQSSLLYCDSGGIYSERVAQTSEGVWLFNTVSLFNREINYLTDDFNNRFLPPVQVTFLISDIYPGSEVRIFNEVTREEVFGVENLVGSDFIYVYTYQTDIPVYIVIFELGKIPIRIPNLVLSNLDQTFSGNQFIDRVYSNI
jgi:hypothetical protein